jgi:DNA-binding transcriptional LysR family regulator
MTEVTQQTSQQQPQLGKLANQGLEFRHLRYLVAVAEAGTFTHAAERMFIAQPTLSQQIRRLEELVGTPLLHRRRDGVQLTAAGSVLLEESRTMLSLLEHGVSRSRQAAGLSRPRLRFVMPPNLPERLALTISSRLRATAAAAGADVEWLEAPLDADFTPIGERRADAGLGWLASPQQALPEPLEVMTLAEFEPEVWIPAALASGRPLISLAELAEMEVIHGPRRSSPGTYDAWLTLLRETRPRLEFTDPPFRHSLPMTLSFAATATRPVAVLTDPLHLVGGADWAGPRQEESGNYDMVRVGLARHPLSATAVVAWSGDLPSELQQVLFDTADAGIPEDELVGGRHLADTRPPLRAAS